MMVEMNVQCTDNELPVVVLNLIKTLGQFSHVVIVYQGDGYADDTPLGPRLLIEFASHQVSNRFGAVGETSLLNQLIQAIEQCSLHRDPKTHERRHVPAFSARLRSRFDKPLSRSASAFF